MQLFNAFLLVFILGCFYPLCFANTTSCNLTNCSRTNVEICTRNGSQCRRFSNECSLRSVNCKVAASSVWNRTDTTRCTNLAVNATGPCFCPELRTCSNQTAPPGICVHLDGHSCRLFRTECDLATARCNREPWRNIDISQCRGFPLNQTRTCICPKSIRCSRNSNLMCVQTNSTNCRLYNNECDLEADRCQGQRLLDVSNAHCQRFSVGSNGTCTCPNLLNCNRNTTNICVKNAANRCQLVKNQCDLEEQKCAGVVLNNTLPVQCRNLRPGDTGDCSCPSLDTCSVNRTNICVRTRVGCRLKTNECELERARCQGEVVTLVSPIQCRNFTPGEGRACVCPRLDSCNRNNTNICVRSAEGCTLLANECDLEEAQCEGRNLTIVDAVQCRNFTVNQLRNCSCPQMDTCANNSSNACVSLSTTQCRLVRNECEVEKARCLGEILNITNPLQCRGLRLNTTGSCFCPRLRNCSTSAANICIRENNNNNTCTLLRSECELERAICEGRDVTRVDNIYCRNFQPNNSRSCFCPKLATCNRNSSSICVMNSTQCRLMRNECEMEQAKCEGTNLRTTHAVQCLNFQINQQRNCRCPNLITCSQNTTRICVKTSRGCKILTTQCELEEARCRGEVLRTVADIHCQGLPDRVDRPCFCPKLKTCSNNNTRVCVRNPQNNCTLLRNECELEREKCRGQALTIVPELQCSNLTVGSSRTCACPNLFNCSTNATSTCLKTSLGCKLLRNQCEVENEKCQRPVKIMSPLHCVGFQFGQTRNCSCPNLKTCSRINSNICIQTRRGCKLLQNECELEQMKCQGQKVKILPAIQCKLLRPGRNGSCACPNWLSCSQNSSRVCIETRGGCRLLRNQCDLEQKRCLGEAHNITSILQCQGFRPGQLKNCACPELKTTSASSTIRVCARQRYSCKLMNNSHSLELAKCRGEKWCNADMDECKNFTVGQQGRCTCPKLQTCGRNSRNNICVHLKGACKIIKNQCELEKAKCNGQAWSRTNSIQCQNYVPKQWQWCSCPRLLNCCTQKKPFCVSGPLGCKIMKTDCELQMARCRGEVWTRTNELQCQGFKLGQRPQKCSCPNLTTCLKKSTSRGTNTICVRNIRGCQLLKNECELERLRCVGEDWTIVDDIQCQNFTSHNIQSCHCSGLDNCSKTTRVCGRTPQNKCYSFLSECDMRRAACKGKELTLTIPQRCHGIRINEADECKCPESRHCNKQQRICGRIGRQCKLFKNACELRSSTCRGETWRPISLNNCCEFNENEVNNCTTNQQQSAVCAQTAGNRCRLFANKCDLHRVNGDRDWSIVSNSLCKCLRRGRTGVCNLPFVCETPNKRARKICGRQGNTHKIFRSQCLLRLHNHRHCTNFRAVNIRQCRRRSG